MEPIVIVLIIALIIVLLGLCALLYYIATINLFNKTLVKIDESEANIDIALTKRFDVLTKLVEATKGYIKHERETLEKIVKLRQPAHQDSIISKQVFSETLLEGFKAINVAVENYPELKSSKNFVKLQEVTFDVEENLQAARRIYNSNISYFNQKVVSFPSSIIARKKDLKKLEFFEAEPIKREDVEFNF